jgi:hypothetical protein
LLHSLSKRKSFLQPLPEPSQPFMELTRDMKAREPEALADA